MEPYYQLLRQDTASNNKTLTIMHNVNFNRIEFLYATVSWRSRFHASLLQHIPKGLNQIFTG